MNKNKKVFKLFLLLGSIIFAIFLINKMLNTVTPDICITNIDNNVRIGVRYVSGGIEDGPHQEVNVSLNNTAWQFARDINQELLNVYGEVPITNFSAKNPRLCEKLKEKVQLKYLDKGIYLFSNTKYYATPQLLQEKNSYAD